jgi:ABC-2 type transport system permease protein
MRLTEQLSRSWAITKKDLAVFYLKGPVLISGILMPSFLFIAFCFGKKFPVPFLVPSLWGMALFVTASSIGPIIAPWETRMRTFERLISAPIALWAIILGDVVASFLFGLVITLFIFAAGIALLGIQIIGIYIIVGTVIASFCFSSLALLMSAPPTDMPSNIMMLSTLIKFPMIFISGVFVPIEGMGKWKVISFISPLTYYTDLARYSVNGSNYFSPQFDIFALIGFSVLLFLAAIKLHKKSLSKRF